jgi:hypothetical protein
MPSMPGATPHADMDMIGLRAARRSFLSEQELLTLRIAAANKGATRNTYSKNKPLAPRIRKYRLSLTLEDI